jgi:NAD(P)H-flavin reductase
VQLHLEEALDGFGGAGALVCGMPVMMEETKKSLARMGFVREDVLVNY